MDGGAYRGVVTFSPMDEVRDYVEECLSAAILAAYTGAPDAEILRKATMHVDQRFRVHYILGNPQSDDPDDLDEDDLVDIADESLNSEHAEEVEASREFLRALPERLRGIAAAEGSSLRADLNASEDDERVIEELFEDSLDTF